MFYFNGSKGINIDADPRSVNLLKKYRPSDININALISDRSQNLTRFFLHSKPSRSTTNPLYLDSDLFNVDDFNSIELQAISLQEILDAANCPHSFDLLKIDVEGLELEVLRSVNFNLYIPKVIIVETCLPYIVLS